MVASPWANLPVTILLFGFFGWQALLFVIGAMLIALLTGLAYMALEASGLIEASKVVEQVDDYEWDNIKVFKFKDSIVGITIWSCGGS